MEATDAAEAALGDAETLQVREDDLLGVADDDPLDLALAVDENADLTADEAGYFGQVTGELLIDEVARREAALVELLELAALAGREPCRIAFELVNGSVSPGRYG